MNPEDTIRRLGELNPVPPQAVEHLGRTPAADLLLERIVADDSSPTPRSRRPRRPRRPGRLRRVELVAAIAAALSLVIGLVLVAPGPSNAPASAAQLLRQVARRAAGAPGPGSGSVAYQATEGRTAAVYSSPDGPYTVFLDERTQLWVNPDGSGRRLTHEEPGTLPSARDRSRWQAAGAPVFGASSHADTFGPQDDPFYDLAGLSDDPPVLRQQLPHLIGRKTAPDDLLFKLAGEVLGQPDATPPLRSALYHVLASLPDVDLLGPTIDPHGRVGVGVAIDSGSSGQQAREILVMDASTGELLAWELVLLQPSDTIGATPPVTLGFTAYLASEMVDSQRAVPPPSP
jgi:hypothetical protein